MEVIKPQDKLTAQNERLAPQFTRAHRGLFTSTCMFALTVYASVPSVKIMLCKQIYLNWKILIQIIVNEDDKAAGSRKCNMLQSKT